MHFLYRHIFLLHFLPAYFESMLQGSGLSSNMNDDEASAKFADDLMKCWDKMLNIGCAVLTSPVAAVLSFASIASSPLTYATGVIIFSNVLISLLFCCCYWAHMARLKRERRVHEWVQGARASLPFDTSSPSMDFWRNTALLLAAPVAWLMWALMLCFPFILSCNWSEQSDRLTTLIVSLLTGTVAFSLGVAHVCMAVPAFVELGSSSPVSDMALGTILSEIITI